jgi:FKBP-type peptidyl-prolyl cis-trans isomerase SlyD
MEALAIAPDTVVTLSYVLFDQNGEAVDRVEKAEPLTYVHGYAQLVPGLERQIEGLKAGDRGSFTVDADEAFGDREDDAIFEVDRADFPDSDDVEVGDEFMAEGPGGEPISMRVLEVHPEAFVVDTNHPLAGQRVRFEVEVASVRPASEEEIAEAQAELEEMIAEGDDACGCGHDHGDGHDHDHDHAHDHDHGHDHNGAGLIQLSKKA